MKIINGLNVMPISQNSIDLYHLRKHAVLGISPFNSFFIEENLSKLFSWGINNFEKITIFLPDTISTYTLQAVGYSKARAKQKTRRQDNYLRNKVMRVLQNLGLSLEDIENKIVTMSQLFNNDKYKEIYAACLQRFQDDLDFRKNCLSTSSWILTNRDLTKLTDDKIEIAVQYLLYEIPLFLNTPYILDIPSSVFFYTSVPQLIESIYNNNDDMISSRQGYCTYSINIRQ